LAPDFLADERFAEERFADDLRADDLRALERLADDFFADDLRALERLDFLALLFFAVAIVTSPILEWSARAIPRWIAERTAAPGRARDRIGTATIRRVLTSVLHATRERGAT